MLGHMGRALVILIAAMFVLASLSSCHERRVRVSADESVGVEDVEVGDGREAREGSFVEAAYRVRLKDGTVVIDLFEDRKTHSWVIGDGSVIPGMDQAIIGMREGGVRRAELPWAVAYGSKGYGEVIPPRANLTVEIEIHEVRRSGGWGAPGAR